ncbi:MAG: exonuclease SbcCD subunit D [Nitrospinaceae bacterium]|nr:MAG: exonuclease SbcCD subunit D [Nitrospinaceae bacterium]
MTSFRFIHCSDLHIDSPFKGLRSVQPEWADKLRASTFRSFQNIVQLAIREKVDAVIIAGDIYDGADKSLQAQLKFRQGLTDLSNAGIPSFIVHGNHDPLDSRFATLKWPDHATVFSGEKVECHPVMRQGTPIARIYGISYSTREVKENLALRFEKTSEEGFAVGVLHTNVGHNPDHDDYAPCSLEDLVSRKMDYWALGHIHIHQVLRDNDPAIVYSGNTQARHKNENGKKGCCLVSLHENSPPEIQFVPTDTVRFIKETLEVSQAETLDQVMDLIRSRCMEISSEAEGRDAVAHLTLTGRTPMHDELQQPSAIDDLTANVQSGFDGQTPSVLVHLTLKTQGTFDIEILKQGNDFIADLLALYESMEKEEGADALKHALSPLYENWAGNRYLEKLSSETIRDLLFRARNLSLDQLVEEE